MDIEKTLAQMTLEEKASLCSGADFWRTKAIPRLGVPSVMMADGPNGLRKQEAEGDHMGISESIPAVCFPTASALAASFDVDLAYRGGEAMGQEAQAEDLAILLGPGVNIKRSPLCGRNFEYYSEDPHLAGAIGSATVRGIQSQNVAACVKHFAGNNQETMRMSSDSVIDERTLHEIYLAAFETIVRDAHPRSVMCAYNRVNGTFMAEHKELLTDTLRDKWGFDGFVVTDWGAAKNPVNEIRAGLDLEMPGGSSNSAERLVQAVQSGELGEEELDRTVRRLLRMIDDAVQGRAPGVFDRERDFEKAAAMAKECAVLLKNDHAVLPLSKGAKVTFIGEFATKPRYQGAGSSHINSARVSDALSAAQAQGLSVAYAQGYASRETQADPALVDEALRVARESDVAVIFAGLPAAFETEGMDRATLDMPQNQNELIAAVAAVQPNTVVVLHNGAPVTMPWLGSVPAVLEMYLGGDGVGEASVALLYGDACPSGKLAETFPLRLEDNPSYLNFPGEGARVEYREGIFVGYRYYDKKAMDVLFPFGHGLSYTTFAYSGLKIDKERMDDTDTLHVSLTVTNTGSVAGKEVVQVYIGAVDSGVIRPVRELKAFRKVALEAGESREITFALDKKAFAYYEPLVKDWFVRSGEYRIEIGASSRDIRLRGAVAVDGTVRLPIVFDRNSTIAEVTSTPQGKAMVGQMMAEMRSRLNLDGAADMTSHLGEGGEQMMRAAMKETPLGFLVSFGAISEAQLQGIIDALNR